MPEAVSREIRLKKRPIGLPGESDFELVEVTLPELEEGEVLVRNIYMSVDPYMRGRMDDRKSYTPPFELGRTLQGSCVGQVVQSKGKLEVGEYVLSMRGWRECYISDGSRLTTVDPNVAPLQSFLGILGTTGLTAYVGLLDIGQPKEGETVFVSGAAGAVGSVVCQIAKIKGCRVVGSAGSDEKVAWLLDEAKVDAAFNYKRVDRLVKELAKHCPDGIDVYFDNVGGEHLEAAITHMNPFGRIVLCGMISQYNATESVPGPKNLASAIGKRLKLQGFIVSDHMDRLPQFYADMGKWIASGEIKRTETIVEGIENAPGAFIRLFTGEKSGKMLVKVGPDPAT
jgi:NADPH-dependent curcumin reductase CurA